MPFKKNVDAGAVAPESGQRHVAAQADLDESLAEIRAKVAAFRAHRLARRRSGAILQAALLLAGLWLFGHRYRPFVSVSHRTAPLRHHDRHAAAAFPGKSA